MDEDLIQALWIEFLNKLEVDWNEKHKQFGDFYDFKNVKKTNLAKEILACLLYTSPSPRDRG